MSLRHVSFISVLSLCIGFVAMVCAPAVAAVDRYILSPFVDYIERSATPDYELVGASLDATTTVRSGFSKPQVKAFRSTLAQRISSRAAMYSAVMSPASAGPALA